MRPTLDQAFTLHRAGRLPDAEAAYRAILDATPSEAGARRGLGLLLVQSSKPEEAIEVLKPLIADGAPTDADGANILGAAQMQTGSWDEAKQAFEVALSMRADHPEALANLGSVQYKLGNVDEAIEILSRAAAQTPENAETYFNLSLALRAANRLSEAEEAARKAILLAPNAANAHVAMGVIHAAKGDDARAIAAYRQGLAADPRAAEAHHNLAQMLLARGELADGWDEFEWRWQTSDFAGADSFLSLPSWDGNVLSEGTLLVWTEQGIGDQILYSSIVPDLETLAPNILIACEARLVPLFARSFTFAEVISQADLLAYEKRCHSVTAQIPAGSLGRLLRRDAAAFPGRTSYLSADPDHVEKLRAKYREQATDKPLVGLSWRSANPRFGSRKSLPAGSLAAALGGADATFVDLQYGDAEPDRAAAAAQGLELFRDPDIEAMTDLDGFAAQVAALDLVITVSNSTAHFAGALGVPAWVLVPAGPGRFWYWFLDRADSPWYPSLRLFRQATPGTWDDVLAAVSAALRDHDPGTTS